MADDLADEGDFSPHQRLDALSECRGQLERIETGQFKAIHGSGSADPVYGPLARIVEEYKLPLKLFFDLLSAFEQDVNQQRWVDDASISDYCRRSANPIGRLMLALIGIHGNEQILQSDAICSALQRINFLQDLGLDWKRGRLYLPLDQLEAFGVREADIDSAVRGSKEASPGLLALLAQEHCKATELLRTGSPLCRNLPGRLGLEITATVAGGGKILEQISRLNFDTTRTRPVLRVQDWLIIGVRTLTRRPVP